MLRELCARADLIALSLHVDYWDYIGWKDKFASPVNSARQRDYARRFGRRNVYTPQIVLNGVVQGVGSRGKDLDALLSEARALAPIKANVQVQLTPPGQVARAIIEPVPGQAVPRPAHILLVTFDQEQKVPVSRGENAGKTLIYGHVVRSLERVGRWRGTASRNVSLPGTESFPNARMGLAVIVQEPSGGPVLGAAMVRPR